MNWWEKSNEEYLNELSEDYPEEIEKFSDELNDIEKNIEIQSEFDTDWNRKIIEGLEDEKQEIRSHLRNMEIEKDLEYIKENISKSEAARLRKRKDRGAKFETDLELAKGGMTSATLYEPSVDNTGMRESGWDYFKTKDWLLEKINGLSEDEALEILNNARGKYSSVEKNYNDLKTIIQAQY
jgi:ribosomal protein L22